MASISFERLTIEDTATGPAAASVKPAAGKTAVRAYGRLSGGAIRVTTDGTTPTAEIGHLVEPGQDVDVRGEDEVRNLKAIRVGDDDGILPLTFADTLDGGLTISKSQAVNLGDIAATSVAADAFAVGDTPGADAEVVVAGVGTLTFAKGLLTDFTPEE